MANYPDWLDGAIDKAEGKAKFARAIGMSPVSLSHILAGRRSFPAKYALAVEREFGVARHIVAPDFFTEADALALEAKT